MRTLSDESLGRLTSEMVVKYLEGKGWVKQPEGGYEHSDGAYVVFEDHQHVAYYGVLLRDLEVDEDRDASEIVREMLGLPDPVAQAWAEAARMLEEAEPRLHNRHDVMELVEEFRRRAV